MTAFEWWVGLVLDDHAGLSDPYGGSQTGVPGDPFISGKSAMGSNGTFAIGQLNAAGTIDYDIVPPLLGTDGKRHTPLSTNGYVLSAAGKHPDEAWALVQALTAPAFLESTWGKPGHAVPARRSAASSVIDTSHAPANQKAILEAMEVGAVFRPYTVGRARRLRPDDRPVHEDEHRRPRRSRTRWRRSRRRRTRRSRPTARRDPRSAASGRGRAARARSSRRHGPSRGRDRSRERWFYLLIAPWLFGLVVLQILPMLAAAGLSFAEWEPPLAPRWVGLDNLAELVADPRFGDRGRQHRRVRRGDGRAGPRHRARARAAARTAPAWRHDPADDGLPAGDRGRRRDGADVGLGLQPALRAHRRPARDRRAAGSVLAARPGLGDAGDDRHRAVERRRQRHRLHRRARHRPARAARRGRARRRGFGRRASGT